MGTTGSGTTGGGGGAAEGWGPRSAQGSAAALGEVGCRSPVRTSSAATEYALGAEGLVCEVRDRRSEPGGISPRNAATGLVRERIVRL